MESGKSDLVKSLDLFLLLYGNPLYITSKFKKVARILFLTFFLFRLIVSFIFWPRSISTTSDSNDSRLNSISVAHYISLTCCLYFYFWLITKRKLISNYFIIISSILPSKSCNYSHLPRKLNKQSTRIILICIIMLIINCFGYSYFACEKSTFTSSHIFQRFILNKSTKNATKIQLTFAITIYLYDICFDNFQIIAMTIYLIAYLGKATAFDASLVYMSTTIKLKRKIASQTSRMMQLWSLNQKFEDLFSTLPFICLFTSISGGIAYVLGDKLLIDSLLQLPWNLALVYLPVMTIYTAFPLASLAYVVIIQEKLFFTAQVMYFNSLSHIETSADTCILKEFVKHIRVKASVAGFYNIDRSFICTTISSSVAMGVVLLQLIN